MKARYYIVSILVTLIGFCVYFPAVGILFAGILAKHPKKWWIIHSFVSGLVSAHALMLYLLGIHDLGIDSGIGIFNKALLSGDIVDVLFGNIFTRFAFIVNLASFLYAVVYIVEKGPPFSPRSSEEEVEESI